MMNSHRTSAFTLTELLAVIAATAVLLAVLLPAVARTRNASGLTVSRNNLATLGVAHEMYAADWNGRQATVIVDNFSTYGTSGVAAITNYVTVNGVAHPPLLLGYCGGLWGYWMPGPPYNIGYAGNWALITPFELGSQFGYFRVPNSKALHDYVGGRFYDETFYAPNDVGVYPQVERLFSNPCGFILVTGGSNTTDPYWSSYCTSPAAMFNPAVMRAPSAGGWQNPFALPDGFRSPNLSQAKYPALKTHMLEHNWNQNPPADVCNHNFPCGTYSCCESYHFNHSLTSAPATLFYDGHVRLLPNAEVIAADAQILNQTNGVDGLWSRDTPRGKFGYFGQYSIDGTIVSHHILTTNGILGRDTLANVLSNRAAGP